MYKETKIKFSGTYVNGKYAKVVDLEDGSFIVKIEGQDDVIVMVELPTGFTKRNLAELATVKALKHSGHKHLGEKLLAQMVGRYNAKTALGAQAIETLKLRGRVRYLTLIN